VIIRYRNVVSVPISPNEANPKLVIEPDRILSLPFPSKGMQPVSRWNSQIVEYLRLSAYTRRSVEVSTAKKWHTDPARTNTCQMA
jgi:hypothetical protein